MRKAERKQIDTEIIETVVPILDEDGNETGDTEVIRKEAPIYGTVYSDMTAEEEAAFLAEQANIPEPMQTADERIADLEEALMILSEFMLMEGAE